ncbi:MAG: class I SAM-dependent methyltransferase [Acetobacteraceae bacterium]
MQTLIRLKYGPPESQGWGPRLRQWFGYYTPDDWYEAMLLGLVGTDTSWLDIGCGRYILPYSRPVATLLAARCRTLVGIDPDASIELNTLLHRRVRCRVEDYCPQEQFDLITLRMVAEHLADPDAAVAAFARLAKPGGTVVVYTVNRFSPLTLLTSLMPTSLLRLALRLIGAKPRSGLHPSFYRMNTSLALRRLFDRAGFREASFRRLDDCRATLKWKTLNAIELSLWRLCRAVRLHYPEICLLGVYRRDAGVVARGRNDVVDLHG